MTRVNLDLIIKFTINNNSIKKQIKTTYLIQFSANLILNKK
jgi:hypothetical protein